MVFNIRLLDSIVIDCMVLSCEERYWDNKEAKMLPIV